MTERALIAEYRQLIEQLLPRLQPDTHALLVEIARVPESIRGYGHVKQGNLAAARTRWQQLLAELDAGSPPADTLSRAA